MKDKPNYYAIIPANVRYSDVPANAKLLYGEITALSNENGYCWASNKYFAELYCKSVSTISVWISHLSKKGFVEVQVFEGYKRKIFIKEPIKNLNRALDKSKGGVAKNLKGVLEKSKDNNTINNTVNNTINKREAVFKKNLATFSNLYTSELLENFFNYWSEKNKSGKKMKFELQKTFEVSKRLATWFKRQEKWEKEKVSVKRKKTAAEEWRELLDDKKESSTFDNLINTNNE